MSVFTRKGTGAPPAKPEAKPEAKPDPGSAPKSGRATFDERGATVWEWQVRTGRFDLNADSQRIRALTDIELSLEGAEEPARPREEGFSPYASAPTPAAPLKPKPTTGFNPYSTGPTKKPEAVSYDAHRAPPKKPGAAGERGSTGSNPYGTRETPKTPNPFERGGPRKLGR